MRLIVETDRLVLIFQVYGNRLRQPEGLAAKLDGHVFDGKGQYIVAGWHWDKGQMPNNPHRYVLKGLFKAENLECLWINECLEKIDLRRAIVRETA